MPVKEKAVAGLDEDVITMSIEAGRNALKRAGISAGLLRAGILHRIEEEQIAVVRAVEQAGNPEGAARAEAVGIVVVDRRGKAQ